MEKDKLLGIFNTEYKIHDKNFYKQLENADSEMLLKNLEMLNKVVNNNKEWEIYSETVLKNMQNMLSVIRNNIKQKTNDEDLINNAINHVNDLISVLNQTNTANAGRQLYCQCGLRFIGICSKKSLNYFNFDNIYAIEELINKSIMYDFLFLESLLYDSEETFIESHALNVYALCSLNFIIKIYPEILLEEKYRQKILDFVDFTTSLKKQKNMDIDKRYIKKAKYVKKEVRRYAQNIE